MNSEFWAEKAMNMPKAILEVYVSDCKKAGLESEYQNSATNVVTNSFYRPRTSKNVGEPVGKPNLFEKIATSLQLDPEVIEELEKLKGKQGWNAFMKEMIELKNRQEKQFQEEPYKSKVS